MMKKFKNFLLVVLALAIFISAATYVHAQQINASSNNSPYVDRHFWIPAATAPNVQSGIAVRTTNTGLTGIRSRVSISGVSGQSGWGTNGGTTNLFGTTHTDNLRVGPPITWSPSRGANCNSTITGEYQFVRNTDRRTWVSAPIATAVLSRCN